jgi:hypothetical protein
MMDAKGMHSVWRDALLGLVMVVMIYGEIIPS